MKNLLLMNRVWNSPTINSWGSTIMRTLSFVLVLPLILSHFSTVETALILLFFTILHMQMMLDMGFSATFGRVIAYAMGGAIKFDDLRNPIDRIQNGTPNLLGLEKIYFTMKKVYIILSLAWLIILSCIGTWFVKDLILQLKNPLEGWVSWALIILLSSIRLYSVQYTALLMGKNKIAIVRKIETLHYFLVLITSLFVLSNGGGLIWYIIVSQIYIFLELILKRHYSVNIESQHLKYSKYKHFDKDIFQQIYPSSWRTGLGVAIGIAIPYGAGVAYGKIGTPEEVSSYLLALNLMGVLIRLSMAPFYSKIPRLARLRAENKTKEQIDLSKRGMLFSFSTLVFGFIVVGSIGNTVLYYIESQTTFVNANLWCLLGLAAFFERYGAMHIQLYSTTNHIKMHIANGVSGIIYILFVIPLYNIYGVYALPLSQLVCYILWYDWYSAIKTYKYFNLSIDYELKTSLIPLLVILLYCGMTTYYG